MADDLTALMERLKALPTGTMLTVLIPTGEPQTLGGLTLCENETFHLPAALFVAPALPAPPAEPPGDAPPQERFMRVAVDILNVRETPDKNARLLGTVKRDDRLAIDGETVNGYLKLSSRAGFVLASGLTTM